VGLALIALGALQLIMMTGILPELQRPLAWVNFHAETFHVMELTNAFFLDALRYRLPRGAVNNVD
jgi:hypothetical protein